MPIRLSGINSGLDTDALVKELVSAYSLKTQNYEKQKTKLEWKKDAWQSLNTKIYGLYTNISNLRYGTAYNIKRTTVSDSTKARVTASNEAVSGTQTLRILETAQASYITGGKLDGGVTASSTLENLGYTGEETSIEVRTKSGDTTEIKISKETKISEFVQSLKNAGLNANFDENNQRFFISAKESGEANDFDLCATDSNSQDALAALKLNMSLFEMDDSGDIVFSSAGAAYQEVLDLKEAAGESGITDYLNNLVSGYKTSLSAAEADLADAQAIIKEYDALVSHKEARAAHNAMYSALSKAGLSISDGVGIDSSTLYKMSKEFYTSSEIKVSDVYNYLKENNITLPEGKEAEDLTTFLNENKDAMKKVASYDGNVLSKKLDAIEEEIVALQSDYEAAKTTAADTQATIDKVKASDYAGLAELSEEDLASRLAAYENTLEQANELLKDASVSDNGAIKIIGSDAKIVLNGAEFTSSTNSFAINGLTIDVQGVTGEDISITTAVDTEGIYDKIKDFLSEYNSVINEMMKLYNADSAGDYEPLTDDEKDAMSDTEIEKWEDKIKSSLLRRDGSLNSVMSGMINAMSQSIEINGKKLSLSSFGISTLGYLNAGQNEQYAYHIDGDEDDVNTSGKTDKLMKAIQEDPDQIIEFMKKLTSNLYNSIDAKMKSTTLSSAYKVYNDKDMENQLDDIEELIEKWEEKVTAEEERYYKQFSNMEVALSKLQSQTNSLSGLLGS